MSFNQITVTICIILSLPSAIVTCLTGYYGVGVLVIIIMLGLLFFYWTSFVQPDFTIISTKHIYTIEDEQGSKAKFQKDMEVRANHKGISQYIHRNISMDGSVKKISTNYGKIEFIQKAGDYTIYHTFPKKLKKWQKIQFVLTMELENTFPDSKEMAIMLVETKMKNAEIRISLPKSRPCKATKAYYRYGSEEKQIDNPNISPDSLEINWRKKKLYKVGSEYEIEWDW